MISLSAGVVFVSMMELPGVMFLPSLGVIGFLGWMIGMVVGALKQDKRHSSNSDVSSQDENHNASVLKTIEEARIEGALDRWESKR